MRLKKHCISPQKYLPSIKKVRNERFAGAGFGFGNKQFYEIDKGQPGPGTYDVPSVFDTNRRSRIPLN